MRSLTKALAVFSLLAVSASLGWAASITGTVKGPDGTPFKGAFVEATNSSSRMLYAVLSHKDGHYTLENLPAGDYRLSIRTTGFKAEPKGGISLTASQKLDQDFALEKAMVRWADLSIYQGRELLPDGVGKKQVTGMCFACHGFQSRMASALRDEDGWRDRVNYMRTNFGYLLTRFNDQDYDQIVSYLSSTFSPDSKTLAKSPADLPKYQEVKTPEFSDDAMRINYVAYEMNGPSRFPGGAHPEKDGTVSVWTYNQARFSRIDPKTNKVTEYHIPWVQQASVHSVVEAPDGSVWFSEQAENAIGKLDPATGQLTKYTNNVEGRRHTLAINSKGVVYATGDGLASFDPKTEKWTNYAEVPVAYGISITKDNTVWFSEFTKDGKIGKIDPQTGKITKYTPPTADPYPRRLKIDPSGTIWFCEYRAGKIARFDPKTEQFKEYPLPGADPTPYALGLDEHNHIWYSSMEMDTINELDPATGDVIEYPFLYSENGMRDFFMDPQGRMWWGSQPNNHAGYFTLTGKVAAVRHPVKAPESKGDKKAPSGMVQE